MAAKRNSRLKSVTDSSSLPLQFRQNFSTPGQILGWMIDERIPFIRRNISPRPYVASRLNISESELSLMISNQRPIKIHQFCIVAQMSKAPEAFQFLAEYTFPEDEHK